MNWFAIAAYRAADGATRMGVVVGDMLYDAAEALHTVGAPPELARRGLTDLLRHWAQTEAPLLDGLSKAAQRLQQEPGCLPAQPMVLAVPFEPPRIFATASNYVEHAAEMGTKLADRSESSPYVFMKAETSVTATGTAVVMPASTVKLDWEVELAVIIGRGGRNISVADAAGHIAGFAVLNDVSARDLTRRSDYPFSHDWFRGKSFDTFGPFGPWFVPASCIADPQDLRLRLTVNGNTMQDGSTADMIFSIAEQIAYVSSITTLRGGDVIATGTPTGVGMGQGIYLRPGDVMVASVDGIGQLRNRVEAAALVQSGGAW